MTATGEMAELNSTGDTRMMWDKDNADEVKAARAHFDDLVNRQRFRAFRAVGKDGNQGDRMREFDPAAERIILVRQLQGG